MKRTGVHGLMGLTLMAAFGTATANEVRMVGPVRVTITQGENRFLEYEVTVPAPLDSVWTALSTSNGLASWAGPAAHVDLRRDGAWDVYFKPDAPRGQRGSENLILAVIPKESLILQSGAPPQFPIVDQERTVSVFEIESVDDDQTLVRMTQAGWKTGEQWDAAFDYLANGNAEWLGWLHRRFTSGPIDWPAPPKG